jgi:hypothetical protein
MSTEFEIMKLKVEMVETLTINNAVLTSVRDTVKNEPTTFNLVEHAIQKNKELIEYIKRAS